MCFENLLRRKNLEDYTTRKERRSFATRQSNVEPTWCFPSLGGEKFEMNLVSGQIGSWCAVPLPLPLLLLASIT